MECIFCKIVREEVPANIIATFNNCLVMEDNYPVSKGHLLIIPKKHYADWFAAPKQLRYEMIQVADFMKVRTDRLLNPAGYNVGMNCGHAAGQTVMHLHMHLIPRYAGDTIDPAGGIRRALISTN